jgi:hypothetical protein
MVFARDELLWLVRNASTVTKKTKQPELFQDKYILIPLTLTTRDPYRTLLLSKDIWANCCISLSNSKVRSLTLSHSICVCSSLSYLRFYLLSELFKKQAPVIGQYFSAFLVDYDHGHLHATSEVRGSMDADYAEGEGWGGEDGNWSDSNVSGPSTPYDRHVAYISHSPHSRTMSSRSATFTHSLKHAPSVSMCTTSHYRVRHRPVVIGSRLWTTRLCHSYSCVTALYD